MRGHKYRKHTAITHRHLISQDGLLVTVKENITSRWLAKAKTRVHIAIIRLSDKVECFKGVKITPRWDVVCCDEQGVFLMHFIQ